MGKSASAPPAPDYTAAAQAQGQANKESAIASAFLSNPNIINPYGTQTVSYGSPNVSGGASSPVFDQAGYDKALAAYNASSAPQYGMIGSGDSQYYGQLPSSGPSGPAPTKEQFTTGGGQGAASIASGNLQPTVTQTLNPQSQAILDAQLKTQLGLANLGNNALSTVQGVMGTPFNYNGQIQTSLGNYGPVQGSVANSGSISQAPDASNYSLQNSFNSGGNINTGPTMGQYGYASGLAGNAYGSAGSVSGNQYGSASGGPAGDAYGNAGYVSGNQYGSASGGPAGNAYGSAGGIAGNAYGLANGQLNLSNVANLPVNAGQTGQAAIMARLQPQIAQGDNAYAAQLANQGIVQGSEAYDNAMRVHNQSNNDLLTQAALQGLGLDFQANSQGFNQALQQGQFGNQAIAQNFGQGLAGQQLTNQAIGQNFGQGQAATAMQNAAIGQNFGQGVTSQNQQNASIAQNFGQGQAATAMQNAAIGQNFGQGLQAQNQANQAIGQNFNQGLQGQQLTNQAIGQNYGQDIATQQAQNAAQQQQFGQNQSQAQFYNTAQGQAYQQALAQQQAQNQAQQQQYGQNLNSAQLYNQAQNQVYNQGLQSAQFGNTAQQQALQQALTMRELPLNEISALMSGSQVQNPQFQPYQGQSVAPAPLFNATQQQYNSGLQNASMQNSANNSFMSGLFGLGGAALGAPTGTFSFLRGLGG